VNYTGTLASWLFGEASYRPPPATISGSARATTIWLRVLLAWTKVTGCGFNSPGGWPRPARIPTTGSSDHAVLKATASSRRGPSAPTRSWGTELYKTSWLWNPVPGGERLWAVGTDVIYEGGELYPVLGRGASLGSRRCSVPAAPDDTKTWTAYLNDTWRLGERLTSPSACGGTRTTCATDRRRSSRCGHAEPRLGVAWDPAGSGRASGHRGVGSLVSTITMADELVCVCAGMPALFYYFYDGPAINADPGQPRVSTEDACARCSSGSGSRRRGQFPEGGYRPVLRDLPGREHPDCGATSVAESPTR